MLAFTLTRPGNRGDDLELGTPAASAMCFSCCPRKRHRTAASRFSSRARTLESDVVLVMPQLVGELLALHRQRDRDDDIGKP